MTFFFAIFVIMFCAAVLLLVAVALQLIWVWRLCGNDGLVRGLCAPNETVQALVDQMAHVQHHATVACDDSADFAFLTLTEFGFGRMRP